MPNPPQPVVPPSSPSPLNPAHIGGVYDLNAPITGFDPAWGDFTGYGYSAVLTIQQNPVVGRSAGTFTDLRVRNAAGELEGQTLSGSITLGMSSGRFVLELASSDFHWTAIVGSIAEPEGDAANSPRIEGTFGTGGHISGTFVATRRAP